MIPEQEAILNKLREMANGIMKELEVQEITITVGQFTEQVAREEGIAKTGFEYRVEKTNNSASSGYSRFEDVPGRDNIRRRRFLNEF